MLQIASIKKEEMGEKFLSDLHKSTFNSEVDGSFFRFDGCLIAKNEEDDLVSYVLVRELSSEAAEIAWGGTSKKYRGINTKNAFDLFVDHIHKSYENVTFQAWNQNYPMLKLGLYKGFKIVGCRTTNTGDLFVIFNKKRGE